MSTIIDALAICYRQITRAAGIDEWINVVGLLNATDKEPIRDT